MDSVLLVGVILLGACVGSFLNVVILRLPHGVMFTRGRRSRCPACGTRIAWYDNLPVLSWFLLRGRCRSCRARISPRYPLVELLGALAFAALWLWPPSGLLLRAPIDDAAPLLALAFHGWFVAFLIASTFIDIDHRILPDALNFPTIAIGLLGALLVPGLAGSLDSPGIEPAVASLAWSAFGVATGAASTYGIRLVASHLFRKEAMGLGDVKFMAAIGAFVGPRDVLLVFLLASALGAVLGTVHRLLTKDAYVPFGPFLAAGASVMLFAGRTVVEFVTVTWPEWQARHVSSPWLLAAIAVLCLVSLYVLVRRGRSRNGAAG
jgi:leader peptidase (prepilin peptidase)/N-methyltransferase